MGQTVKLGPKSSTVEGNQLPYQEWYRLQICLFGRGSSRSTTSNFGSYHLTRAEEQDKDDYGYEKGKEKKENR